MRASSCAVLAAAVISFAAYRFANGSETLTSWRFSQELTLGKQIAPVPLNVAGKNPDIVYLGSYVVNAIGGCNDCHTCPSYKGINPFQTGGGALGPVNTPGPVNAANYLAGGTRFGPVIASNLTPDSTGLPGGMTYDQFLAAMQQGSDRTHPGRVLQVMPWPHLRSLSVGDLSAVYTYLQSLPTAQPGTCTGSGGTQ